MGDPKEEKSILSNIAHTSMLFDLYGNLLTEKKRRVMELYHEEDMSLSEIAEEFGISRAAVHDSLQSAEKALVDYECKLGLLTKQLRKEKLIGEIRKVMEDNEGMGEEDKVVIRALLTRLER